jgi:hypothetical protein
MVKGKTEGSMLDSMSQSEQIREDKTMLSLGLDVLLLE